jgi:DNA-binding NtrC family response regulator
LKVLSNRLRKRGIEVGTASSGAKAIQSLRRADFDVAVVDLKMEDMGGIEVLQIFKKMAPEMPIIILTGHGSEQALKEGMTSGAYDYLMKPCDIEDLLAKVKEAAEVDDHKGDDI